MKTQAIIAAGGQGVRLKTALPKTLVPLRGKPILAYTLAAFERSPLINSIVVVGHKGYLPDFQKLIKRYRLRKVKYVVAGGKTRRESVDNGLKILDKDTDFVAIHDGARPFVTKEMIAQSIACARKHSAAIIAVPVKPTIKAVNSATMTVGRTLDRKTLWEVQTPQVFKKEIILKAHSKIKDIHASDDACLVEKVGIKVKVVAGDYRNIKITTPDDLIFARAILACSKKRKG
ncbi:MAG TPA: 2-C-methyl-D-erythritol 4-phosphate cytidylyltransferase [Candidatus Omnitrophota bacterium]|nr:2-C-methyl-D-erythritol 4-phosphate cytidylyltransferase [Candidatus Omnitrophota bacterium]HPD84778.1 2-C-methyl-D-erythritol 4-phosphate cytidylyltransferase [Candidatus Omnitrophota bacterium]HRZ03636.1 2-C-methyl-D-erythritol 4-phosphate cytidylyltransferase [Candidatus Omnitrophota bacterium]